jgi:predicted Zn-dependent protease
MTRLIGTVFAVLLPLAPGSVTAQGQFTTPQEVVLYVHQELEETDFVDPLVCELSRVLVSPVRAQAIDLPLDKGLLASPTQFDTVKLAGRLLLATARDGGHRVFRFLLFPYDLRTGPLAYVFGSSFGSPYDNGIVSTARIRPTGNEESRRQASRVTIARAYKMILRYVARLSGMRASNGCVLAMPTSIDELDGKSAEFCDDDRAVLVEAGIVKARPGAACGPVAMIGR